MSNTVRPFEMKTIASDSTVLVLGKRGSGKSWLLRDIMYHQRHLLKGIVMSGTDFVQSFFSQFIPEILIYSDYQSKRMEELMESQANDIIKNREQGLSKNGKTRDNNVFVIIDDLQDMSNVWKRETTIKTIFYNGRHYNIFFLLALQYMKGITPDLRENINYVFLYNQQNIANKKKLFEEFGGVCGSFKKFDEMLKLCTQDYRCLVINTSGKTFNETFFHYKAQEHGSFRVCHPKLWEHQKKYLNNNYRARGITNDTFSDAKKVKVMMSRDGNITGFKAI